MQMHGVLETTRRQKSVVTPPIVPGSNQYEVFLNLRRLFCMHQLYMIINPSNNVLVPCVMCDDMMYNKIVENQMH